MYRKALARVDVNDSSREELLELSPKKTRQADAKTNIDKFGSSKAVNVVKWDISRCLSIALDISFLALILLFFAFGIAVKQGAGSQAEGATFEVLTNISRVGPTIYPILFAAVAGRSLRAIALWRIEKGARIGYLDQLVGSTSITTTIVTQLNLRSINMVSLVLIVAWALSPVGGQASIRIIGTISVRDSSPLDIQAINMSSNAIQYYDNSDRHSLFTHTNALFAAAFSSSPTTRMRSSDSWGNVKIPFYEILDNSTMDTEGWIAVSAENVSYASLIGLPISVIPKDATAVFFYVETNYWWLTCPVLEKFWGSNPCNVTDVSGWQQTSSKTRIPGMWLASVMEYEYRHLPNSSVGDRPVMYCGPDHCIANCSIANSYVEARVDCKGVECAVSQIRRSRAQNPPSSWLPIDPRLNGWGCFADFLVTSLGDFHLGYPTPFQAYLVHPDDPFNYYKLKPTCEILTTSEFALGLSQIFNTWWSAIIGQHSIEAGNQNPDLNKTATETMAAIKPIAATVQRTRTVMVCNDIWLTLFFVSLLVLLILGTVGSVATFLSNGPDLGFNVSSLVKDNPYMQVPTAQGKGSSALGPGDRSRLLRGVKVKYGDVAENDEFGFITIARCEGESYPASFRKGRYYR